MRELAAEGVAEPWRQAGGIRDLTPDERELWRVYCLAKRVRVDLPAWVLPALAWIAEAEETINIARQRAAMGAMTDGTP